MQILRDRVQNELDRTTRLLCTARLNEEHVEHFGAKQALLRILRWIRELEPTTVNEKASR